MDEADDLETDGLETEAAYLFSQARQIPLNLQDYAYALSCFRVARDTPWGEALRTYTRVETRINIANALRRRYGIDPSIKLMTEDLRQLVRNATLRNLAAKLLDTEEWKLSIQELKAEIAHDATERAHEVIEWRIGDCFDDDIVHTARQKIFSHIRHPDDGKYVKVSV